MIGIVFLEVGLGMGSVFECLSLHGGGGVGGVGLGFI